MTKLILKIGALVAFLVGCSDAQVVSYEIPNDYVGKVKVTYGDQGCANGRAVNDVIRVRPDGTACSSRKAAPKTTWSHFYYVDSTGRRIRELRSTGWGKGGEIWGEVGSLSGETYEFFVGSEKQFTATYEKPPTNASAK